MDLLILCLLSVIGFVYCKNTYITTVPQYVRPGEDAKVCITPLIPVRSPVFITLRLMNKDSKVIQSTSAVRFMRYRPVTVTLEVPITIDEKERYSISVRSRGGLIFYKTAFGLSVLSKTSSIFVQTDKATYKPGDLMQYRVFGTDAQLKIMTNPLDIYITDPKNNRMQQHMQVLPEFGVFTGSFQLSTLTNLGKWNINVEQERTKYQKAFSVERYVLPRFEVNIIMPSFQLKTSADFTLKISAKYTFGKPVSGVCNITIKGYDSTPIIKTIKIHGVATVNTPMKDVTSIAFQDVTVSAVCAEGITGISVNDTQNTNLLPYPEIVTLSSSMANTYKPGLPYYINARATNYDGTPLDPLPRQARIEVVIWEKTTQPQTRPEKGDKPPPGERRIINDVGIFRPPNTFLNKRKLLTKHFQLLPTGIIKDTVIFPLVAEKAYILVVAGKNGVFKNLERARSPSNSFIQVSLLDDHRPVPNRPIPIMIETTEKDIRYVNFKVTSQNSVVSTGRFRLSKFHSRTWLRITYAMVPSATLLVYYTRQDGEIVADAVTFTVDDLFKSKVEINFDEDEIAPGRKLELNIRSTPKSLVCVLGVDKSVLLLKTGNDITKQDVLRELRQYEAPTNIPFLRHWDSWFRRPFGIIDASSIFDRFGVKVLTDAYLYRYFSNVGWKGVPGEGGGGRINGGGDTGGSTIDGGGITEKEPALPKLSGARKHFPETWIWSNVITGYSGTTQLQMTAPDTITEWITSAFVVNPRTGLGIASEFANLTTFQRFFMRFDLPYSAIRGEQVVVQISVFNYLPRDQRVVVKFENSKDYVFVDYSGKILPTGQDGFSRSLIVRTNSVGAVYIPIEPLTVGKLKLTASARCIEAADAVEREFLIEAEGIKQSYNIPLLINLKTGSSYVANIDIDFPPNTVRDSEFIKLQVIGDLLGSAMDGIEDLLKMSYGCGEQNMLGFVANVYVSSYLKATNRLTPDLEGKAKKYIEAGYQRELTYAHDDGSYSVFGNRDKSGSTWLTAYVIKSFSQAAKFVYIDKEGVMKKAISWIIQQQKSTGAFREPGRVSNRAMQGGSVSSERSLTSFVLIALEEARRNGQVSNSILTAFNRAIYDATKFISQGATSTYNNTYELAITFYALSLVKHSKAAELLNELENEAHTADGGKYWKLSGPLAHTIQPWKSWKPPRTNVRAIDVETTSYVLLGYNLKGDTINGIQVLNWLGKQRNPYGGFISTQDTVIALQALSGLAIKLYVKTFSMTIVTRADNWPGKTFTVNNNNALVLQSEDLPKSVNLIAVNASGTGLCLLQVAVYYNVYDELRMPAFDLRPTVLRETIYGFTLRTCFRWLRSGESTMGLLEINIPSGMEAVTDSVDASAAHGQYTMIEPTFQKVNLFFDAILSVEMCIEIDIRRTGMVAKQKPQPIRLSEYYEPSNEVIKTYVAEKLARATITDVCGTDNCQEAKE